jgi:hypothetical protein
MVRVPKEFVTLPGCGEPKLEDPNAPAFPMKPVLMPAEPERLPRMGPS